MLFGFVHCLKLTIMMKIKNRTHFRRELVPIPSLKMQLKTHSVGPNW